MFDISFFDERELALIVGRFRLTPTEERVVRRIAKGMVNKEIANDLRITTNTLKIHLRHIYAKIRLFRKPNRVRMLLVFWKYVRSLEKEKR